MNTVRLESFMRTIPLELPFANEFRNGFVTSAIPVSTKIAEEIMECHAYMPLVEGMPLEACRPIFKWSPLKPTYRDDIIKGRPSDQSADVWDFPCGIMNAKDVSSVYACIDRTFKKNSWWREADPKGTILAVRSRDDKFDYMLACIKVAIPAPTR